MKNRLIYISVSLLVILAIVTSETMMAFENLPEEFDIHGNPISDVDEQDYEETEQTGIEIMDENNEIMHENLDKSDNTVCDIPDCDGDCGFDHLLADTELCGNENCLCEDCDGICDDINNCVIVLPPCGIADCICKDCDGTRRTCSCVPCTFKFCECEDCDCFPCGPECDCIDVEYTLKVIMAYGNTKLEGIPLKVTGIPGESITDRNGEVEFIFTKGGIKTIEYSRDILFYEPISIKVDLYEELFEEIEIQVSITHYESDNAKRTFLRNTYIYIAPLPGRVIDLWLLGGGGGGGGGGSGPATNNKNSSIYNKRQTQSGGGGGGSGYARNEFGLDPSKYLGEQVVIIGEGGPGGGLGSGGGAGNPTTALNISVSGGSGGVRGYSGDSAYGGDGGSGGATGGTGTGYAYDTQSAIAPTKGQDASAGLNGSFGPGNKRPFNEGNLYYGGGGGAGVGRARNATLLGYYWETPGGSGAGGSGGRGGTLTNNGAAAAAGDSAYPNSGSGGGGGAGGGFEGADGGSPGDAGYGGSGGSGRAMMRLSVKGDFTIINLSDDDDDAKAVNGAEFEIIKDGVVLDVVTIDEGGRVDVDIRDYLDDDGEYIIRQIKNPPGYKMSKEREQIFHIDNSVLVEDSVTFINEELIIKIIRTDLDGNLLAGSEVNVSGADKYAEGNLDEQGLAVRLGGWQDDTYTVEEMVSPAGYYNAPSEEFVILDAELLPDIVELKSSRNYITIIRTDDKGSRLSGAQFSIIGNDIKVTLDVGNCKCLLEDIKPCYVLACECIDCDGLCECVDTFCDICGMLGCNCLNCNGECNDCPGINKQNCGIWDCACINCNGIAYGEVIRNIFDYVEGEDGADGEYLVWPKGDYTIREEITPQGYLNAGAMTFNIGKYGLSREVFIFSSKPIEPEASSSGARRSKNPGEDGYPAGSPEPQEPGGDNINDKEVVSENIPGGKNGRLSLWFPDDGSGSEFKCGCSPDCTCGEDCLCLLGGLCDCCNPDIRLLSNEPGFLQNNSGGKIKMPSLLATLLAALALLLTLLLLFLLRGRKLKIMRVDENNQLLPLNFTIQGEDVDIEVDAGAVVYKVKVRKWKDGLYTITERTKDNYITEYPIQGIMMEDRRPDRWKVIFNCVQ